MWGYEMLGVDTRGIDEILLEMGVLKIVDLKKAGIFRGKAIRTLRTCYWNSVLYPRKT